MQYSNKCKICGTNIISSDKIISCEACGSDDISHTKILSHDEKVAKKCINAILIVVGVMISLTFIASIIKLCC